LINANLPPISFVDFAKKEYIISMLAFMNWVILAWQNHALLKHTKNQSNA